MNHEYFKDRVSAFHDGELKHEEAQMMTEHLQACDECRRLLADLEKLDQLVSEHSSLSDSDYWERSAQRIDQAVSGTAGSEVIDVRHGSYRGLWWKVGALSVSAAVILFIAIYQGDISKKVFESSPSPAAPLSPRPERELVIDSEAVHQKPITPPVTKSTESVQSERRAKSQVPTTAEKLETSAKVLNGEATTPSTQAKVPEQIAAQAEHDLTLKPQREAVPELAPSQTGKTVIAKATDGLAELKKRALNVPSFAATPDSLSLENWKDIRDSLQGVLAIRSTNQIGKTTPPKGASALKSLSEAGSDPDKLLLDSYYHIAVLTADSLEFRSSVDSLKAYAGRRPSPSATQADDLLKRLASSKK